MTLVAMIKAIKAQFLKQATWGNGGCWYEPDATKSYWEKNLFYKLEIV